MTVTINLFHLAAIAFVLGSAGVTAFITMVFMPPHQVELEREDILMMTLVGLCVVLNLVGGYYLLLN